MCVSVSVDLDSTVDLCNKVKSRVKSNCSRQEEKAKGHERRIPNVDDGAHHVSHLAEGMAVELVE